MAQSRGAENTVQKEAELIRSVTEHSNMSEELSMEARLALIDLEIRTLHQFCVNKGYNPWQIEASAKPVFDLIKSNQRKKWLSRLGKLGCFLLFCLFLFYYDPAYRIMCSYGKRASIQVSYIASLCRLSKVKTGIASTYMQHCPVMVEFTLIYRGLHGYPK